MKNKISDLRDHLFVALERLGDEKKPMEIDRAKAIAEVAQTIINSAKVEVDFLRVAADLPVSLTGTGFMQIQKQFPDTKP